MALKIHKTGLASFRTWLEERGLADGSIDAYVGAVKMSVEAGGFIPRLRNNELAPKTRRVTLAAARRWADFDEDAKLLKQLKEIRLPPPRRKTAKVPITREQLLELIDEIERAEIGLPMRAVLLLLACRGLRCGDALRLQRDEVLAADEKGSLSFEAKGRRQLEFKVIKTFRKAISILAKAQHPLRKSGEWRRVDELIAPHGDPKGRRKAAARAVERELTKIGVRLGILGLYPHRLRRTYAVEYLRTLKGDPEALIKLTQHMQWASMATAMEYVDHARGDELDKHAEKIFDR